MASRCNHRRRRHTRRARAPRTYPLARAWAEVQQRASAEQMRQACLHDLRLWRRTSGSQEEGVGLELNSSKRQCRAALHPPMLPRAQDLRAKTLRPDNSSSSSSSNVPMLPRLQTSMALRSHVRQPPLLSKLGRSSRKCCPHPLRSITQHHNPRPRHHHHHRRSLAEQEQQALPPPAQAGREEQQAVRVRAKA